MASKFNQLKTATNIAIFGGCFDPFHLAHLNIIEYCFKNLNIDYLIFLPSKAKFHANHADTYINNNLSLIKAGLNSLEISQYQDKIYLSLYEYNYDHANNTYNTLCYFKNKLPNLKQINLVIGYDQYLQFHQWRKSKEILGLVQLVVFPREIANSNNKSHVSQDLAKVSHVINNFKMVPVSSTEIRCGNKWNYLPQNVLNYIHEHQLYYNNILKFHLSPFRYQHTIAVAKLAKKLAKNNNVSVKLANVAALFHDFAREMNVEQSRPIMAKYFSQYLNEHYSVWHQYISAYLLENQLKYSNQAALQAIKSHTIPTLTMSTLDKILFCADKTSYDRNYSNVTQLRKKVLINLNDGFQAILYFHFQYLLLNQVKLKQRDVVVAKKYLSVQQLKSLNFD